MSKTDDRYDSENEDLRRQVAAAEERAKLRERLAELGEAPQKTEASTERPKRERSEASLLNLSPLKLFGLAAGAVALPVALALLVFFVVQPRLAETSAQEQLDQLTDARGAIMPANRELVTFTGQKVESANAEQKALGSGGSATEPSGFIFTNGKSGDKKRLDIYVDFAQQTSRDFLLLNQDVLRGLVEGGAVDLYIHPIPGGTTFSMYGPEAVAEAIYYAPEDSWNYLITVLKLSAEIQSEGLENDEIAKALAKRAKEAGIGGIDQDSIQNGTFASWLLSIGNDSKVAAGLTLPALYVDDQAVDTTQLDLNDSDALRRYISSH